MRLYNEYETDISSRYLKEVVKIVNEPVCILGGWAVYFTVNERVQKEKGSGYLGSKDIDLGFHIDTTLSEEDLKETPFAKTIILLEQNGFESQSYRYYKDISIGTGEALTNEQSASIPTHDVFKMYIDLIVDDIHPAFEKTFGFTPIDESLLTPVFGEEKNRIILKEFGKMLWVPIPELLLATKIKSLPSRTADNKKIKDVCDIYSLGWYSGEQIDHLKEAIRRLNTKKERDEVLRCIQTEKELFDSSARVMGIEKETIKNLVITLLKE